MLTEEWSSQMHSITSSARFLANCDVLDIHFSDGDTWEVYVAATPDQRRRGLSEVSQLDLAGMLFVYEQPSYVPFVMKHMDMDLDIAWFDSKGTLLKKASFSRNYSAPICCSQEFSYVLEAPIGTIPEANLVVRHG